ncbi:MAG: COG4315 family predicted lipoprotein [Solirubrobacteraceae bacterium]
MSAVALSGVASARTVLGAHAARGRATVALRNTRLGKVLVNGSGYTLYLFTRDRRDKDSCASVKPCFGIWPPDISRGKPRAGAGVKASLLGTIALKGGARQVTYAGQPLYGYVGDMAPGSIDYGGTHQFGGRWYPVNAAGHLVKPLPVY